MTSFFFTKNYLVYLLTEIWVKTHFSLKNPVVY